MKSDLDFLNDTLSSPVRPITSPSNSNNDNSTTTTIDPNEPNDLASILATLKKLSLEIPRSDGEEVEGIYDESSAADDLMISELLAKMDQAEGAADGLEARLDSLLGRLDGLLGDLGEDEDGDLRKVEEVDEKDDDEKGTDEEKEEKENKDQEKP